MVMVFNKAFEPFYGKIKLINSSVPQNMSRGDLIGPDTVCLCTSVFLCGVLTGLNWVGFS